MTEDEEDFDEGLQFTYEKQVMPSLAVQIDEGEYVILKNHGYDLMESVDADALNIEPDGTIYALKKNEELDTYEWINITQEKDNPSPFIKRIK